MGRRIGQFRLQEQADMALVKVLRLISLLLAPKATSYLRPRRAFLSEPCRQGSDNSAMTRKDLRSRLALDRSD